LFYSTLTLRFDPVPSAFDDGPLALFSKSREILSVREHFFVQGEIPHLLLCITWRMPPAGSAHRGGHRGGRIISPDSGQLSRSSSSQLRRNDPASLLPMDRSGFSAATP